MCLNEAATLAHVVPGVTLRLHCRSGAELLVSATCLGADLVPCRLRATLLYERAVGSHRLASAVTGIDLVAGLRPLGAGLYERHTAEADERWFVTTLAADRIAAALADGPSRLDTVVTPDPGLGLQVVCLRPAADLTGRLAVNELDETAVWALAAVLIAELDAEPARVPHRQIRNRSIPHQPFPHKDQP